MMLKHFTRRRHFSISPYAALIKDLTETVEFDSQNRITNIPEAPFTLDPSLDHAPRRIHTLNDKQVDIAIKNHLKYFSKDLHEQLAAIFREELNTYGHIYAFNYLPRVPLQAIPYNQIHGMSIEGRAMMHMIMNNLDPRVA